MNFTHRPCGSRVEVEVRQIVSQPNEKCWPRDPKVKVPFCPTCKAVVGVDELERSGNEEAPATDG